MMYICISIEIGWVSFGYSKGIASRSSSHEDCDVFIGFIDASGTGRIIQAYAEFALVQPATLTDDKTAALSNVSVERVGERLVVKFQKALDAIENREMLMQWAVGRNPVEPSGSDGLCDADVVKVQDPWCYEVRNVSFF